MVNELSNILVLGIRWSLEGSLCFEHSYLFPSLPGQRNLVLGREDTPEEKQGLADGTIVK